jgi:hypothetical protein
MMVAASSMPKAFQLSGDGKAYDDAFKPKLFTATPENNQKEQSKKPEQPKPKISFDR